MLLAAGALSGPQQECTLEPAEGVRREAMADAVSATMTWHACTSMARDLVFEWPTDRGVPATPRAALERAAALVREWERITKTGLSPFGPVGDVSSVLEKRAAQPPPYELGGNIPVTDNGVAGWDGVWVTLSSGAAPPRLTVHYWANP
jgi:hypothetical protein